MIRVNIDWKPRVSYERESEREKSSGKRLWKRPAIGLNNVFRPWMKGSTFSYSIAYEEAAVNSSSPLLERTAK